MRKRIRSPALLLAGLALLVGVGALVAWAENIDPFNSGDQYTWGENVGWLNAEPGGDGGPGVQVTETQLTGYMWGENIGWVSMSCQNTGNCAGPAGNWRVTNDGAGHLAGYAWAENVGWISFSCQNTASCGTVDYGVQIDPLTGVFSGYAWGDNIGWVSFSDDSPVAYGVVTLWTQPHYACHDAPGTLDPAPVDVETQFGTTTIDPQPAVALCAPALKNGQGDLSAAHLRVFPASGPAPGRIVNLTTQFGELNDVVVGDIQMLSAPASKVPAPDPPPPNPDEPHYLCYSITGPAASETVTVESQFTPAPGVEIVVGQPQLLCLPAGKNGAPIPDAAVGVCYGLSSLLPQPYANAFDVQTQFGIESPLYVYEGQILCVPAVMEELACPDSDAVIGNGKGILGDDKTVPNGEVPAANDCVDTDNDNDGYPNDRELMLPDPTCPAKTALTSPRGDITYDDNNDGNPAAGSLGGTDPADSPPSWDSDGDGVLDGAECTLGTDPANRLSKPTVAQCGGLVDTDGDGLLNAWETCKWGTDPNVLDSDGDTLADCKEAADVDGNGVVNFTGDVIDYAKAALLPTATFGKDGDFDINGDNAVNFTADVIQEAKFGLLPGLCK
jgi:hypothetical protein